MRKIVFLAAVVILLALVPVALAGGWATITIDEMPGQIRAGEPWSIDFTVLQHGQTPVHDLGPNIPVEPTFVATNAATGEEVVAVAQPEKEVGRFWLEVTLPSEGEWAWTIYPAPLAGEVQYEPLTVLPALAAASAVVAPQAVVDPKTVADPQAVVAPDPVVAPPALLAQPPPAAEGGVSMPAALRWAALGVALLAVGLVVAQTRRRAQPAEAK